MIINLEKSLIILFIVILFFMLYKYKYFKSDIELFSINQAYDKLYEYNKKYFLISTYKSFQNGINPLIFGNYNDYIRFNNIQYNKNKFNSKENYELLRPIKIKFNPEKFDDKNEFLKKIDSFKENFKSLKNNKKKKKKKIVIVDNKKKNNKNKKEITEEEINEEEYNSNNNYRKSKKIISNNTLNYRRSNWDDEITKYNHRQPNKNIFNDYGWSYMPPASWSVPQERPPSCIPQKECPVCPTMDDKYASALKWDSVGSIMPKFRYKEIYNPDYYMPGWTAKSEVRYRPKYYGDTKPVFKNRIKWKGKNVT